MLSIRKPAFLLTANKRVFLIDQATLEALRRTQTPKITRTEVGVHSDIVFTLAIRNMVQFERHFGNDGHSLIMFLFLSLGAHGVSFHLQALCVNLSYAG